MPHAFELEMAEECELLARDAHDESVRAHWLRTAHDWRVASEDRSWRAAAGSDGDERPIRH